MYSLVVPVYRNEGSIPELIQVLESLNASLSDGLEVVFVVDGNPDRSHDRLAEALPAATFRASLVLLSRNFGSFAAIRVGLESAAGPYYAVMAADLQEPVSLILDFFKTLESGEVDLVIGARRRREDPFFSSLASRMFWTVYRWLVQREMPPGGVDVFGCNHEFRGHLISVLESNSSLIGLLFWLGFRRKILVYDRRPRAHGRSAWTFLAKLRYVLDSIFAFSDLPIQLMTAAGILGLAVASLLSVIVFLMKATGAIHVPGYAMTVLIVMFFGGLNSLGLGIIGSYVWRTFENTKSRPHAVIMKRSDFKR
jgi:glycosyltransferase involved in cell wall biosynthesis